MLDSKKKRESFARHVIEQLTHSISNQSKYISNAFASSLPFSLDINKNFKKNKNSKSPEDLLIAIKRAADKNNQEVIPTCCFSCNMACEVLVYRNRNTGIIEKIEGDPSSPVTRGIICPKGLAAFDLLYNPERLKKPLRRTTPRKQMQKCESCLSINATESMYPGWQEITWDEALNEISQKLLKYKSEFGARSIAFLEGTRRGWSRVYSRLANAFGSPNHGAAGWAQCLWPRLVDCKVTFGAQYMESCDFPNSNCILVWGSNPAMTWPIQASEIMDARERGSKLIAVDPRLSETAAKSDIWLRLKPGTDTDLALGIIHIIISENLYDHEFVRNWTIGFDELCASIKWRTPDITERLTGVKADKIIEAAFMYAKSHPACISRCVTVDQTADSIQTCRALSILAAITGNIDVPGGNILVSNRGEISQNTHEFILSNLIPQDVLHDRAGYDRFPLLCRDLSPVPSAHMPTLWEIIRTGKPYPVKAALIFGSNALISYTNSNAVSEAMDNLEFIVVCDMFMTPTTEKADIVLPASSWLERDNVISSFQTSREHTVFQQKCISIDEARSDVDIICDLAKRLDLADLFWGKAEDLYDYLLSPIDITFKQALTKRRLSAPIKYGNYLKSGFNTPSGKVELYSSLLAENGCSPLPVGSAFLSDYKEYNNEYPYRFSTGARSIFFRHTENRRNPWLIAQEPYPLVYINPQTASSLGIFDGDAVEVRTAIGYAILIAKLDASLEPDFIEAVPGWAGIANINRALGWEHFSEGIGTVPMRGLWCNIKKAQ